MTRYALVVMGIVTASLALASPLLGEPLVRQAAAYGALLAAANTVLAYALVLYARGRSPNVFLGAVLGGMVGRLAFVIALLLVGVLWVGLPKLPLAVSLLAYFTLFLVYELSVLHRQRVSGSPA